MFELLPLFVAGELSFEDRTAVLEALRVSPELRRELERWQRLTVLLSAAAALDPAPPAELSQRIGRQIALRYYLQLSFDLLDDIFGAYARATAFYAGLSTPTEQ